MTTAEAPPSSTPRQIGRREANAVARRRRILESARALLAESGPDGLSMRKLAREAGFSVTTLYNLVGSREDILQALIEDSRELLEAPEPAARCSRDPLRRAAAALDGMLSYMIDNGDLTRSLVIADMSVGYWVKLSQNESGRHFRATKGALDEAVSEALAAGQLRDIVSRWSLLTQLFMGHEAVLHRWAFGQLDDERFRLKSLSGFYVALLAYTSPEVRPGLEKELCRLDRRLARLDGSRKDKIRAKIEAEAEAEAEAEIEVAPRSDDESPSGEDRR